MFVLFPVHKVHNDAGRISSKEKAFFWQLTLSHKVAAHVWVDRILFFLMSDALPNATPKGFVSLTETEPFTCQAKQ